MNALLTGLGVPLSIQEFFQTGELLFNYGGNFEEFTPCAHRIPTTRHLWIAGDHLSSQVIITHSAMEAIAYLTLNMHRYPLLKGITCVAIGNLPHDGQLNWIRSHFQKQKYTLVFGNELLGVLADIRVAAGLAGKKVTFRNHAGMIRICLNRICYQLPPNSLSLSVFEKTASIRTGCRTVKPKIFNSFLDQLKHDATQ